MSRQRTAGDGKALQVGTSRDRFDLESRDSPRVVRVRSPPPAFGIRHLTEIAQYLRIAPSGRCARKCAVVGPTMVPYMHEDSRTFGCTVLNRKRLPASSGTAVFGCLHRLPRGRTSAKCPGMRGSARGSHLSMSSAKRTIRPVCRSKDVTTGPNTLGSRPFLDVSIAPIVPTANVPATHFHDTGGVR
jgi:hypothetical protein